MLRKVQLHAVPCINCNQLHGCWMVLACLELSEPHLTEAKAANLRPQGAGRRPLAADEGQQRAKQSRTASGMPLKKLRWQFRRRFPRQFRRQTVRAFIASRCLAGFDAPSLCHFSAISPPLRICNVREPLQSSKAKTHTHTCIQTHGNDCIQMHPPSPDGVI